MTRQPRSNRPTRTTTIVGAGVFVACLAGGALLGRLLHHDVADAVPAAEALPVLQPSGYGPANSPFLPGTEAAFIEHEAPVRAGADVAADATAPLVVSHAVVLASTAAVITDTTTGGGAPGTTVTNDIRATTGDASTTTTAAATTTAAGGTDTTDVRGPTLGEPPIAAADLPALLPDADLAVLPAGAGVVQILDPCADGGDGCPAGLETTILAGGIEPLSIVEATTAVTPGRFAIYDECRRGREVDARSAVLAIVSNHPASFTISGHWSGDATTSQRLRQRYAADRDRGDVHNVVTCAVLTPANERGEIRIAGVDDFASSASRTVVIDAQPFDHKRPPISVTPTGGMTLQVLVPVRPNETAEVVAVTRFDDSPTPTPCLATPMRRIESTATQRLVAIPAFLLTGPGYPFDPTWDRVAFVDVTLTEGATPYDLCVRWFSRQRSFDTPQLIEVETRIVQPPTRNDVQVSIEGVIPGRQTVDPRRLGVEIKAPDGAPRCAIDRQTSGFPLAVGPDKYTTAVPMCLLHTGATGEWLSTTVTYDGVERRAAIRASTRDCHTGTQRIVGCTGDFTEWYELAVPKEGGSPGGGTVILRFDYQPPHGPFGGAYIVRDAWTVFGTGTLATPGSDTAAPFATQPQLDLFTTTVRPEGGTEGQSILVAQWAADRPVTIAAFIEGNNADTCSRDPRPTVASGEPAAAGTLRLEGLCAGTRSQVGITLTDPATGRTSTFSDVEGAHADRVGPGFTATTNGIPVSFSPAVFFASDLSSAMPNSVVRVLSVNVRVNGQFAIYAEPYDIFSLTNRLDELPCSSLAAFRWTPASYRNDSGSYRDNTFIPPSPQPALWPEDVHISIEDTFLNIGTDPCAEPNGHPAAGPNHYHHYDFTVTTAGPDSALLTPHATYGADPGPRPGLVVQLNARPG